MEEEMVSTISNEGTNVINAEGSDSNSSTNPCPRKRRRRDENSSSSPRFKGVVMQPNGHWGGQIYANHHRIWLGTFKTEKEAAMAYDSAAIKLRRGDSHRNLPLTELTLHEPNFQNLHSTEAILSMIKDGSYQTKFMDFLMSQCLNVGNNATSQIQPSEESILYHELFHKELTPSDVGKLNRLVVPKKNAMTYFPLVPEVSTEVAEHGDDQVEAMNVAFFDEQLRLWNFRYCYWKSSQSFVFTKGWNRFVKEKELKAKDIITFYRVEHRGKSGEMRTFYLIDAKRRSTEERNEGHEEQMELHLHLQENFGSQMEEERRRGEQIKGGIRLFGVNING